jgi:hypothetical protein
MNTMRPALALLVVASLAAILSGAALARWSANGSGQAGAAAKAMPAGSAPVARVSGSDVGVSWTGATFAGGDAVAGYTVRRYDAGGNSVSAGGTCAGIVTATTCTEQSVPSGSWTYTDTPVQQSWTGPESPNSNQVQVPGASPLASSGVSPTTGLTIDESALAGPASRASCLLGPLSSMGRAGIEPATLGLKVPCSTN